MNPLQNPQLYASIDELIKDYLSKLDVGGETAAGLPGGDPPPAPDLPKENKFDYVSAVTGGLGLLGSGINMAHQDLGLSSDKSVVRSATGEPVYTGGANLIQAVKSRPRGASIGEITSNVATGVSAGSSGGVPGMIIGAAAGLVTSLVGGNQRKKRQEAERRKAIRTELSSQQIYNKASRDYETEQNALTEYRRRRNMKNRLYNLYSLPNYYG